MAKKKQPDDVGGQVNFKASTSLYRRLEVVANVLGLDMANLARMIISENLFIYEKRARDAEENRPPQ